MTTIHKKPSIFQLLRKSNEFVPAQAEIPVDVPCIPKHDSIWERFDRKTADELLTRDWFIDDQHIYDIIDCADEEAWDFIYTNRHKYSMRIRQIIEPNDYRIPTEKLRIKVRDLSDKDWEAVIRERKRQLESQFENHWSEYSECLSERPLGEPDSLLDDALERLSKAKDKLTKYIASRPKTYMAPSMRGKQILDPKQKLIENEIRSMENEFEKAQKAVEASNSEYWETKKNEYRKTWMPKLSSQG